MKKSVLALTMGDPGGIGPEVIAKTFRHHKRSSRFHYLLIGTRAPFERLKQQFGLALSLHSVSDFDLKKWSSSKINFLEVKTPRFNFGNAQSFLSSPNVSVGDLGGKIVDSLFRGNDNFQGASFDLGKVSRKNAIQTHETLRLAAENAAQGLIQGIVTAPINKTTMRLMDPRFLGHTEYLAKTSGAKAYAMMFVGPKLKVTLTTIHVPISGVSRLIRRELVLEKIQLTHAFLKNRFKIKNPKIGVCALNPHGRETGTEDEKEIRPAVEKARRQKINAIGPLSADQLFHDAYEGRFDAVISMYHDQGLAPFKMIAFRDGVNLTLGLPYVRTSPDHGTAFDIAYQNKADAASFESALSLAERLIR